MLSVIEVTTSQVSLARRYLNTLFSVQLSKQLGKASLSVICREESGPPNSSCSLACLTTRISVQNVYCSLDILEVKEE